jgi:glycosyltransferase involved in cell wall biosynthesis
MRFETRIFKTAETLRDNGVIDHVILLGRTNVRADMTEVYADRIDIRRMFIPSGQASRFLRMTYFGIWSFWVFLQLVLEKPQFLNIHSATLLPFAGLQKLLSRKCRIIYDAHELETETNALSGPAKIYKTLCEKLFLKYCHHCFVVSPMIRDWYRKKYNMDNISVLLNAPLIKETTTVGTDLRKKFNLQADDLIIAYVGLFARGRGVDLLLNMADQDVEHFKFIFIGFGPEEARIRSHPLFEQRVFFLEPQPQARLLETLKQLDFGCAYFSPTCVSQDMALPNKFFEYLNAGVPVIVGPGRQLRQFISEYEIGFAVDNEMNVATLHKQVREFLLRKKFPSEIQRFLSDYNWQNSAAQMISVYRQLS